MGNCNNIIINPDTIEFFYKDKDIIAFHNIEIKILNKKEIKNIKKNLQENKKITEEQINNIINILKYINNEEDTDLKSKMNYYIFLHNYVPILKIINTGSSKRDNNFYYKMCYLDKINKHISI